MPHVNRSQGDASHTDDLTAQRSTSSTEGIYSFVTSERTEFKIVCLDSHLVESFELPIIDRLTNDGLLSEGEALRLRVAVQEALANAIEHGCLELESTWREEAVADGADKFSLVRQERLQDPRYNQRVVLVSSYFDGRQLEISVCDDGRGFLAGSDVKVGDDIVCSISCSGRGLELIANAADEVKFNRNGAEIVLIKRIRHNRS
jgi:anti-sigma regulatory factor (Ser/Thr protein kinase)